MDLGFAVPTNLTPVLLEFKRNNVVQVSAPASPEDAPQPWRSAPPRRSRRRPPRSLGPSPPASSRRPSQPAQPAPAATKVTRARIGPNEKGLSDVSKSVVGPAVPEN